MPRGFARKTRARETGPGIGSPERIEKIAFPAGGLFVAENLAAFEACCHGEVKAAHGALIAWSAGYPSRAFRRIVELAGAARAPLRIWTDLDLDGIRIARLIASWHPSGAAFFRRSPADLASSPRHRPLTARSLAAIRRNLEEQPEAPLSGTLRATGPPTLPASPAAARLRPRRGGGGPASSCVP